MEIALWGVFWLLIAFAFLGCFINKFPGPVLALIGVLMAKLFMTTGALIEWWNVVVIGVLVIASWWLTKLIPKWVSELGTYGKGAKWGSIIGSIAALIIVPALVTSVENPGLSFTIIFISAISMTFVFASGLEFLSTRNIKVAAKNGGIAAFEYTCSTLIKLITVVYAVYFVFAH